MRMKPSAPKAAPLVTTVCSSLSKDVTRKASIIAKPEPGYTEEARKNNVTGEVLLRVVLSSNGTVS